MPNAVIAGGLFAAVALGLVLVYILGHRRGYAQLAAELRDDAQLGRRALEDLARRHGARLEFLELPGAAYEATEEPTNPEKRRR